MRRRLFAAIGFCLAITLTLASLPEAAQEKEGTKPDRVEGTVQSIDKATSTVTVALRGTTIKTVPVIYSNETVFTFRNKAGTVDQVKDGRHVICLGKLNDKSQLIATRIDVRDE